MCDGILDASLLLVYEKRFRPEERHEKKWIDYQTDKVKRGLDVLEKDPPAIGATPDAGQIALACALGYQDLRFQGSWRKSYPKLVAWHRYLLTRRDRHVPAAWNPAGRHPASTKRER